MFLTRNPVQPAATQDEVLSIRASCDALDRVQSIVIKDYVLSRLEQGEDADDTKRAYEALQYITNLGIQEKIRHYEADYTRHKAWMEALQSPAPHHHHH